MRSVVVLPQPGGPSSVVKLARGISSETSSTAAAAAPTKRLVSLTKRTCGSSSGIGDFAEAYAPTAHAPDHQQHRDGHADDRHRKRRGTTPVEVVDQLKDGDGGDRRARCEQENHHGQSGDRAHKRGDQSGRERTVYDRD